MNRSASASRYSVLSPGRRISRIRASVPATMRPARAMISISRGDFRVIMLVPKSVPDPIGDLLYRAHGRNPAEQAPGLVPVQHRRCLLPIGVQASGHGAGIIIGPLLEITPSGQTGHDLLVRHIEKQHRVHPAPTL